MKKSLKQILGNAAYATLVDSEIRTIRSIVKRHNALSLWYRVPGGLTTKIRTLWQLISYDWKYTRKLTTRHYYLAFGRKFSQFDRVDFINNQYSPYLRF